MGKAYMYGVPYETVDYTEAAEAFMNHLTGEANPNIPALPNDDERREADRKQLIQNLRELRDNAILAAGPTTEMKFFATPSGGLAQVKADANAYVVKDRTVKIKGEPDSAYTRRSCIAPEIVIGEGAEKFRVYVDRHGKVHAEGDLDGGAQEFVRFLKAHWQSALQGTDGL